MRRSLFDAPKATTTSPMLALLPTSVGALQELPRYSASFFARAEKVEGMRRALIESGESDSVLPLVREAEMLKILLDWISGQSEGA